MNTNKFKFLLCCYIMGVAWCSKIGNPSYMDGGGDRKGDKKQGAEASSSVVQITSTVTVSQRPTTSYHKMLEDSLSAMKRTADATEQAAICKQEASERAIQVAASAKTRAEMARKVADDAEKTGPELGGGDA